MLDFLSFIRLTNRMRFLTVAASCSGLLLGCNASRTLDDSNADAPALRMRGKDQAARSESHLLVLDNDAIAAGLEPTLFSETDVKGGEPAIGNRHTLAYFADHVGEEIVLPAGSLGDEGWFAFTHVRHHWKTVGPDRHDGLRNYYEAGPGLGSPDAKGRNETLLEWVPGLVPLRATGLGRLEGRSVCALVLDGDVSMKYRPMSGDLRGRNLGKVAFYVLSTAKAHDAAETDLPQATVRILDAGAVCNDELKVFSEAPAITSQDMPRDTDRPDCVVQKTVLTEEWNTFNPEIWVGDGDQVVADGLFFARPSAFATAAHHIPALPVPIETNGAVRFSNRLQLDSEMEAPYAQSGALFMVNADKGDEYKNFAFVSVGYTLSPSFVFVEIFGSDNGVDFDQFEQTAITFRESRIFSVDLWVKKNAYMVGIGGEMADTVHLQNPLASTALFEVMVQQNPGGLTGLLHSTSITQLCPKENKAKCRKHWSYKGKKWKNRLGKKCLSRNGYIRLARERIKHVKNPSKGLRCLAQMREMPET